MKVTKQKVNTFIALWRTIKLFIHFSYGAIKVFLFVKHYDDAKKAIILQDWSKKLLSILDIGLIIKGQMPAKLDNTLIVSNHISWLDILIIFTVIRPKFVAKKEIAKWFIIGQLTKAGDTIFIDRNNKKDIMQVNRQLSSELSSGNCIAVFPEGTTSKGESLLPFKASLFEPIYQSKGKILPITIQYKDCDGKITSRPSFAGEVSLLTSIWRVLSCYQLTVTITFHELLMSRHYPNRNALALAAQEVIRSEWD